ncbi:ORF6N domain-containing protein [Escherichia coli]|nr:ORF6N domain-containing protein [Escherichia coli]
MPLTGRDSLTLLPVKDISVQLKQFPAVEFHGQRVVTFAMIDTAHQRPKDTAKKTFQRNRTRFIDGEDFLLSARQRSNGEGLDI